MKKKPDLPKSSVARFAQARKKSIRKAQSVVASNRFVKRNAI